MIWSPVNGVRFVFAVIPGAFQSAVHGVVIAKDYKTGVETTFRAGGCNASRGGFIGACLAAQVTMELFVS